MANQQFIWEKSPLQEAVDSIPIATKHELAVLNKDEDATQINLGVRTDGFIGISVEGELVGVVSPRYCLVQHKEAFAPIVKGLDNISVPYEWNLFTHKGKAWLSVLVDDKEIRDTVKIGFRALNSVDGTTAIRYSFVMERATQRHIELVGYRQVCSNGMVIRVPLDDAEIIKPELREKVVKLLEQHAKIIHTGDRAREIQAVQYVVEAVTLLREPVARIIEKAQTRAIGHDEAKELLQKYVGKRMKQRVYNQFLSENPDLWGLYNSITYVASHDRIAQSTSNGLLNKAADLLEQEISVKQGA